jgi:hypothetical protein
MNIESSLSQVLLTTRCVESLVKALGFVRWIMWLCGLERDFFNFGDCHPILASIVKFGCSRVGMYCDSPGDIVLASEFRAVVLIQSPHPLARRVLRAHQRNCSSTTKTLSDSPKGSHLASGKDPPFHAGAPPNFPQ